MIGVQILLVAFYLVAGLSWVWLWFEIGYRNNWNGFQALLAILGIPLVVLGIVLTALGI